MKRFLVALLPLCLLCTTLSYAQDWIQIHSQNLRMIANSDSKTAANVLWNLEEVRTHFGHMLNRNKVYRNRPILVLGLRGDAEVRALAGGKPTLPGGFALSAPNRDYLVIDLSASDLSGVYRAYALLLLNANYPKAQPWFDEGAAQVLAGFTANDKEAELGPSSDVARTLQTGKLLPVSQLISPGVQQSPEFRATSWLLFRWLQDSNLLEASGQYFGQVILQRVPPEQAFAQSFSIAPKDVDAALAKVKQSASAIKKVPVPAALDKLTFASIKLPPNDAAAFQAQFELENPARRAQALAQLQKMLSVDHDSVEINRGLGIAYQLEGDLKSSADHIRRAIELKDDSAEMHYLLATYYNQGSSGNIQVDSAVPSILLQTDKALTLDPEFSNAYPLMAQAQLAMQRPDLAAKSMNKALILRPRDEGLLLSFASIQIENNKVPDAKNLLAYLKNSDDKLIAQRAGELFANADTIRKKERKWADKGYVDPTADKWKPTKPAAADTATTETESAPADKPDTRKVQYLKGTLLSVQCSEKSATLKVRSGKGTWMLSVPDRSKAVLIGADNFQCEWKDVPVSVNYRASGAQQGDIVSLEVD